MIPYIPMDKITFPSISHPIDSPKDHANGGKAGFAESFIIRNVKDIIASPSSSSTPTSASPTSPMKGARRQQGVGGGIALFSRVSTPDRSSPTKDLPPMGHVSLRSSPSGKDFCDGIAAPPSFGSPTKTIQRTSLSMLKSPHLRVLIVDDSVVISKMASLLLQRFGHTVHVVENGQEAVDFVKAHHAQVQEPSSTTSSAYAVDVILMDFQMPVMNGIEAMKAIRQFEEDYFLSLGGVEHVEEKTNSQKSRSRSLSSSRKGSWKEAFNPYVYKIIGFSAKSDLDEINIAFRDGKMNDFITKPFTIQAFNEACSRIGVFSYDGLE